MYNIVIGEYPFSALGNSSLVFCIMSLFYISLCCEVLAIPDVSGNILLLSNVFPPSVFVIRENNHFLHCCLRESFRICNLNILSDDIYASECPKLKCVISIINISAKYGGCGVISMPKILEQAIKCIFFYYRVTILINCSPVNLAVF